MTGKLVNAALIGASAWAVFAALPAAIDHQLDQASGRVPVAASAGGTARPAISASSVSRRQALQAIRLVFKGRAAAATRVAMCETGGTLNVRAVGRQGERGIFQIHPVHFSWAQPARLFDPVWNSRVAYRLSRGGTRWSAWSCGWAA